MNYSQFVNQGLLNTNKTNGLTGAQAYQNYVNSLLRRYGGSFGGGYTQPTSQLAQQSLAKQQVKPVFSMSDNSRNKYNMFDRGEWGGSA